MFLYDNFLKGDAKMKRKLSFGITLLLMFSLLLLAFTACGEKECEHSYQGSVTKAATCESDGVMTYTCSLCTDSYTEVIISGGIHTTANGACTGCGIPESTPGLEYAFYPDDKTYIVTGIGSCTSKDVVIGVSNNRCVTAIGSNAFSGCESLTSVTIGDSVTSIGEYAFRDCTSLTSVTIPDSVTSIGDDAFSGCRSLASVVIPNSVTSIGNHAFDGCRNLASVTIPDSVTSIGSWAFSGTSLTSVTIPDSVTIIGEDAFYYCTNITNVTIPDSVIRIGDHAFYNSKNLTIYCEATTKPNGWSSLWIYNPSPVVWGYKG